MLSSLNSILLFLATTLILLRLLPFVLGPIAVYRKHRIPIERNFFPLTSAEIASCTTPIFADRVVALTALGFQPVINLHSRSQPPSISVTIFHNTSTGDQAHVTEICMDKSATLAPVKFLGHMEFCTEYEDGQEIDTTNGLNPTIFGLTPERKVTHLPGVENAHLLYRIHRSFTESINVSKKPLSAPGTESRELQAGMARTLDRQRKLGYLKLEASKDYYSPTVKGAIIMTWKLAWPVGAIRRKLMVKQTERLVAMFGEHTNR